MAQHPSRVRMPLVNLPDIWAKKGFKPKAKFYRGDGVLDFNLLAASKTFLSVAFEKRVSIKAMPQAAPHNGRGATYARAYRRDNVMG